MKHPVRAVLTLFFLLTAWFTEAQQLMNALSARERHIVNIGMYTAAGDMPALKEALEAGLDGELAVNEIKEILVQLYAYCGFPRSLNALGCFMGVMQERAAKGIADTAGALPGPMPEGASLDFGTANQTKLCGAPVRGRSLSLPRRSTPF